MLGSVNDMFGTSSELVGSIAMDTGSTVVDFVTSLPSLLVVLAQGLVNGIAGDLGSTANPA